MTWVRLDDTWAESEPALEAGPLACWLHVCALSYCNRTLSDGRIRRAAVRRLADTLEQDPLALAARLVEAGLWAQTDDGFELVDYAKTQPTREKVEQARAQKTARQARWREARSARVDASTAASVDASRDAPVDPAPSHPNPPRPEGAGGGLGDGRSALVTRLRRLRATWQADDIRTAYARIRGLLPEDHGDSAADAEHFLIALASRKPIERDLGNWLRSITDDDILCAAEMPLHRHPTSLAASDRSRKLDEHPLGAEARRRARAALGSDRPTPARIDVEALHQLVDLEAEAVAS